MDMGGIELQTINIDKLKDLKGYEWKYKSREFLLLGSAPFDDQLTLVEKNYIDADGYMCEKRYRSFSLKNLTELEFFGLKVILNEKPKLTREERNFVERFQGNFWIVKISIKSPDLMIIDKKPIKRPTFWETEKYSNCVFLDNKYFNFITWESGKAWSKAELMELEVVE